MTLLSFRLGFRATCFVGAFSLFGCHGGPEVGPSSTGGDLGNGVFQYACVDDSDPLCSNGKSPSEFPERVGLGGTFDISFQPSDDQIDHFDLVPAAPGVLEANESTFLAKSTGEVALLAKRTSDGRVFDFIHLAVVDIAALRLDSDGESPSVVWTTGTQQTLRATAIDDLRQSLAGARVYEWTTSAPRLVRLDRANPTPSMDLSPLAPGSVTITVTSGDANVALPLSIEGKPVRVPDAGVADAGREAPARVDGGRGPEVPDSGGTFIDAGARPDASLSDGGSP